MGSSPRAITGNGEDGLKETRFDNLSIRIVGHRRPWNLHFRLTARQWKVGLGVIAGVLPLLLAVGVYGVLGQVTGRSQAASGTLAAASGLRREVVSLTQTTTAGLDAMALQLGVLNSDAARLTALRNRLVRAAGIHAGIFTAKPSFRAEPVSAKGGPRLMGGLQALSRQLGQQNPAGGGKPKSAGATL